MRKKIYLHSSNIEYARDINQDFQFEPVYSYPQTELEKSSRNEWGKINTSKNEYHIILGNLRQKNCPWCGGEGEIREVRQQFDLIPISYTRMFIECTKCLSRGPLIYMNPELVGEEYARNFLMSRYEFRKSWDSDLKFE